LRFGLTEKERAGLKPGATWPKNENASRVARRSTERDNHIRIDVWYTREKIRARGEGKR
jgi:hypothetical protein